LAAAVARFATNGSSSEPGLDELVALDREVRAVFATGPIGAGA
jgi:hypothetical protein